MKLPYLDKPLPAPQEDGYRRYYLADDIALTRKGLLLFSATIIINAFGEYGMFGATLPFFLLLAARLFMVALSVKLYFQLPSVTEPSRFDRWIMLYGLSFSLLAFPVLASRPASYIHSFLLVLVVLLGFYVLFPTRLACRLVSPVLLTVGSLIIIHFFKEPQPAKALQTIWGSFILVNVVGVMITVQLNKMRRRQYTSQEELRSTALLLRQSETKFSSAFHASLVAMAISTIDEGRYMDVNEAFTQMTGYDRAETVGKTVADLRIFFDMQDRLKILQDVKQAGNVRNIEVKIRAKNGERRIGLFSFSPIQVDEQACWLSTCIDITERKNLQNQIAKEVELAGIIQRAILPAELDDDYLTVRSIFQPYHGVSGDSYGYRWTADNHKLFGYLLDVTGHGMATALQSASIGVLMNRLLQDGEALSLEGMKKMNRETVSYFTEGSYAALILFEFDLPNRLLRCATGGINYFWASSRAMTGKGTIPGGFVGLFDDPEFTLISLPIHAGDTFYFVTDGIGERLDQNPPALQEGFDQMSAHLAKLATRDDRWDDCAGLCIKVKAV